MVLNDPRCGARTLTQSDSYCLTVHSASLKSIQLELKDKKISLKELASKANHSKKRIDQHYVMLNTIRSERASDADDGIKSEEFEIMQVCWALMIPSLFLISDTDGVLI